MPTLNQVEETARRIYTRRIEAGTMSAALMAHRTGLSRPMLCNWKNARRSTTIRTLDKILRALGIELYTMSAPPPWRPGTIEAAHRNGPMR